MANGANYIGQKIGNYRIERELASGGFGTVYLAKHTLLQNRIVAIKLLHAAHLTSQKERDQFLQEAQLLEKLKHPHILPLLDVGLYNNVPYLVSEYAPQGSLRDRLDRGPKPLAVQEMVPILSQVGQALQFAHDQNVIHRDLKPENILFNTRGEALLADFGIATTLTTKSIQRATVVGTFDYMAPEQFQGMVSKESDQYALGCLAYELATGQHPFNTTDIAVIIAMHLNQPPTDPAQLNPRLPTYVVQAILKALAKQRADRHANITAFIAALQAAGNTYPAQPQKAAPNAAPGLSTAQALPPTVPVNPAPAAWSPQTKDEWIREGHTHYNAQRYNEALTFYEEATLLAPTDATTHNNRGNALFHLKRYQEALVSYNQAILLNPKFALAFNGQGDARYELNQINEAYQAYTQATQLDPNLAQAHIGLGNTRYYWSQNLASLDSKQTSSVIALQEYEKAIKINPDIAEAHLGRGLVLYNQERFAEGLAAFQQAIRLNPQLAMAYQYMGNTLSRLGFTRQAQEALEKARQLGYKEPPKGKILY